MMRIKPLILTGFVIAALTGGTALKSSLHAQDYGVDRLIVLAQSDSGKKQGFFGRIFNRSDSSSGVQPLYLNNPKNVYAPSDPIEPYNYSRTQRQHTPTGNKAWDAFEKARAEKVAENTMRAKAEARMGIEKVERAMQVAQRKIDAALGRASKNSDDAGNKRMIYDPERVWTYNPNRPQQNNTEAPSESQSGGSRIYNRRH